MAYVMNPVENLVYYMATIHLKFILASTPTSWNDTLRWFFFNQILLVYKFVMYIIHARRFSASRLLRLWVRIPPGPWMFVCCECCVLSGRVLCDELITRTEESYRLWRVVVCDQETSKTRRLKFAIGL